MVEGGDRSRSGSGPKDMQQVYLIRRVVALAVGILVLFSCCVAARWSLNAVSSVRQQLAAKPAPEPKVQRIKPKPQPPKAKIVVAWQPSHQDDTGNGNWHEFKIAGAIVDAAMIEATATKSVKAWDISDGLAGSNSYSPEPSNTQAFDKEIAIANAARARYFISVHIGNGGSGGVEGFFMDGDGPSKLLAERLVIAIASKTSLPTRGVTGTKLYSLESRHNKAKYRVLIEIGGTSEDIAYLQEPKNQKAVAAAMAGVLNELGR